MFILLGTLIISFTIFPAAGYATVTPGFIREIAEEIEAEGGLHAPSPMSPVGWRDDYTFEVPNENSLSTVEVQVIIPLGFTLVSWREPEGWISSVLKDDLGVERVVVWN